MNSDNKIFTATRCGFLFLILALSLWLRLIGFTWGLPTAEFYQTQTYYPDEQLIFITLKGMDPAHLKLRPSREGALLGLGPFYAYLVGAATWAAQKIGWLSSAEDAAGQKSIGNVRRLYELGRAVNLALGLLTIVALFIFVTRIHSPAAGLLSALILGVLPIHVYFCHTMARDISQLFFWMLSLMFLSRVESSDEIFFPGLAGFSLGLSAACKYSSFLLGAAVPLGIFLLAGSDQLSLSRRIRSKSLMIGLSAIFAGYLAGNPYSLGAFFDFAKEFAVSLHAVGQLQSSDAFQAGGGWKFFGATAWVFGAGISMAAVFALGFIRSLARRDRWDWILLAAAVPYLAVNMASHARFVRYLMPVVPLAIYWAARLAVDLWKRSERAVFRRVMVASIFGVALLLTFRYSWSYVGALNAPDTRLLASEWMTKNIPAGSSIGTGATPYFHHPDLISQQFWHPDTVSSPKYKIVKLDYSRENIEKNLPDYIVLSDYDYFPLVTLSVEARRNQPRWAFLDYIYNSGKYRSIQSFEKDVSFFGPSAARPFFPHDWRYPFPSIMILERADHAASARKITS